MRGDPQGHALASGFKKTDPAKIEWTVIGQADRLKVVSHVSRLPWSEVFGRTSARAIIFSAYVSTWRNFVFLEKTVFCGPGDVANVAWFFFLSTRRPGQARNGRPASSNPETPGRFLPISRCTLFTQKLELSELSKEIEAQGRVPLPGREYSPRWDSSW